MRKIIASLIAISILCGTFGGGWIFATAFESPAQRAARAVAPIPGPITAAVTRGSLDETISTVALVTRRTQQEVSLASAESLSVVTAKPLARDAELRAGAAATEINGRPVLAIPGVFPFYRQMQSGDVGPDVSQLQAGLQAAGYGVAVDGEFGGGTEAAVRAMYRAAGYSAAVVTEQPTEDESASTSPTIAPAGEARVEVSAAVKSKVVVPMSELMVFTSLPGFIVSAPPVGSVLDVKSSVIIEHGDVLARAAIPVDVANQIQEGMTATLTGSDGTLLPARIGSIVFGSSASALADAKDPASPDREMATLEIVPTDEPLPATWLHSQALALITLNIAAADSLLIPSLAVVTGGRGQASLLKQLPDGSFLTVGIKETAALSGRSAIAVTSGELAVGDLVKVG